ncbi:glucuronate isomerase [Chengkuizengella axinellae]|uniref:Uronate isomerase n=1 Tax=Chengkuizengella axinellae TaxID=3064388 RepID=A0ABT9IXG1_9BACL|nr:glucuronate isomerase [Chengkuizengella sp. 2205SS18-9]MDP5274060.1 glucuronate isomerase [Chengkuizengella sp. 2205SS18-9]
MSTFLSEDMMLNNKSAQILFHEYADKMPIFDFHTHLEAKEIAENKKFQNITDLWLAGDHYKWRAMRWLGLDEQLITGNASDKEKFMAWAQTVPYTMGNPLYHWTHLELSRYFGIQETLSSENANEVWEHCNKQLEDDSFSVNGILRRFQVKAVCTTDDPIDSLAYHHKIHEDSSIMTKVLPTFRPDLALNIHFPGFKEYVRQLESTTGKKIVNYESFITALEERVNYFHRFGCRISDHGFGEFPYTEATDKDVGDLFKKGLEGLFLSNEELNKFQTKTMIHLAKIYNDLGWSMQLHIGAIRNNNTKMYGFIGANTGYDSILDFDLARNLNAFLNDLDKDNDLPKTIVYNLNPIHNDVVASTIGNFQSKGTRGKIQFGSGWWFNDQKEGMLNQMKSLANIGLISTFIGMLTDSRSFLSFPRHEYFRRILCDLFGTWIENGELPRDYTFIGSVIEDICYRNAVSYFNIQMD